MHRWEHIIGPTLATWNEPLWKRYFLKKRHRSPGVFAMSLFIVLAFVG